MALTGDGLLQVVGDHLVVLDDAGDGQLEDAIADGVQLGRAPHQAVHGDGAHLLLEQLQVGLVVPRLDVQRDHRLGNDGLGRTLLVGGLGALGQIALVLGVGLGVVLEQVKVVVLWRTQKG